MAKRGLLVVGGLLLFWLGVNVVTVQLRSFAMNRYGIASSAMEPTLHCARPDIGCEGDTKDRVFAVRLLPLWTPSRGDIIVFETPTVAKAKCGAGGTFVRSSTERCER